MGVAFMGGGKGSASVVRNPKGSEISNERIAQVIAEYFADNPIVAGSSAKIGYVVVYASEWVNSGDKHSQEVQVLYADGSPYPITENSQVDLTPTAEQLEVFYGKDVAFVAENYKGVVKVTAIGQKPENDYTFQVTVTEVNK